MRSNQSLYRKSLGLYAGEIEIPARSPTKAKLEIKEGEFKLTTLDGTTISGTVSAVTTCDYTSAAFRVLDAAGNGEEVQKLEGRTFSLRAKLGKSLSLTNTAGEKFTFRFKCDCNYLHNSKTMWLLRRLIRSKCLLCIEHSDLSQESERTMETDREIRERLRLVASIKEEIEKQDALKSSITTGTGTDK
jgi:hypothetical protein